MAVDPLAIIPKPGGKIVFPPFLELTKLIYAEPGVGKTTFCSSAPFSFVAATEPGSDFITVPGSSERVPSRRIFRWAPDPKGEDKRADFHSLVRALAVAKAEKKLPYKKMVVDIVDNLYAMCLTEVCQRKGLEYPPENDFGKTWKEIRVEWETWLRTSMDLMAIEFITHCGTDKIEIKTEKGMTKELERRIPTFKGNKAAQFLDGVVNCQGFAYIGADGKRKIKFSGDLSLSTKDRTGLLESLGEMPLDWAFVAAAYEKKAKELGYEIKSKWA